MEKGTYTAFYTYIMTNNTHDKFLTGYTEDLVKLVRQFHQSAYRRNYLPADKQDCFLLVFIQSWPDIHRAILQSNVLHGLTDFGLKARVDLQNPQWCNLNIELLHHDHKNSIS